MRIAVGSVHAGYLLTKLLGVRHEQCIHEFAALDARRVEPASREGTEMTEARGDVDRAASPFDEWLVEDPEVLALLGEEIDRQSTTLQLIASENFTSPAVLAASGSVLTNKYSEGYPGRRYYGGNYIIDEVENLARDRATALFGAEHANVQPHAGANANLAVYQALLNPGDTVLAMRLDHGGHLTHGSPGEHHEQDQHFVGYGVTPGACDPGALGRTTDFDEVAPSPSESTCSSSPEPRHPRLIDARPLPRDRRRGGRPAMFDIAHPAGLVAGAPIRTSVGIADVVTLTTHKTLRTRGGAILCDQGLAKAIDSAVFPVSRAVPRARGGGQGGGLPGSIAAGVSTMPPTSSPTPASPPPWPPRDSGWCRGTDNQFYPGRSLALRRRAHRQAGPRGPRPGRDHSEPQHPRRSSGPLVLPRVSASAWPRRPRWGWGPPRWPRWRG